MNGDVLAAGNAGVSGRIATPWHLWKGGFQPWGTRPDTGDSGFFGLRLREKPCPASVGNGESVRPLR
jgi:hypothetical protein